jgi:hypothetical protein
MNSIRETKYSRSHSIAAENEPVRIGGYIICARILRGAIKELSIGTAVFYTAST